jgi:hypothetical protein
LDERRIPLHLCGGVSNDWNKCTIAVSEQFLQREREESSEPPVRKKTKHPTNGQQKTTPTFLLEP